MDKIVIHGGRRLKGEVRVSGAKNAALPILACAILAGGTSVFRNVPELMDVRTMAKLLRMLGADGRATPTRAAMRSRSPPTGINKLEAPYELVKTMRASVLVLGPLVARYGQARVSLPGGCAIGARPIDQHLKGLEAMGARIDARARLRQRARARAAARRHHRVRHGDGDRHREPDDGGGAGQGPHHHRERRARARGRGAGARAQQDGRAHPAAPARRVITIEGVDELQPIEHAIIPDRIEAGTFMVAAAHHPRRRALARLPARAPRRRHRQAARGRRRGRGRGGRAARARARATSSRSTSRPSRIPGFPTDMQAQFMVLTTRARRARA